MTKDEANNIAKQLQNEGYEAEVTETYSGRGMFGKCTCGVITDAVSPNKLTEVWHCDGMGMDVIYY